MPLLRGKGHLNVASGPFYNISYYCPKIAKGKFNTNVL